MIYITFVVLFEGLKLIEVFLAPGAFGRGRRFKMRGPVVHMDCIASILLILKISFSNDTPYRMWSRSLSAVRYDLKSVQMHLKTSK